MAAILDIIDGLSADGSPVIIEELTGLKASVVLGSRARPEQGVEITDTLRYQKTHYAGNNTATIHVMGMEYDDIILNGRFKDAADYVITAAGGGGLADATKGSRRRVELLRGLMHRQSLCQLSWGDTIVRQGVVAMVKIIERRHNHCRYQIRFAVAKAGEVGTERDNTEQLSVVQRNIEQSINTARFLADTILRAQSDANAVANFVQTFARRRPDADRDNTLGQTLLTWVGGGGV